MRVKRRPWLTPLGVKSGGSTGTTVFPGADAGQPTDGILRANDARQLAAAALVIRKTKPPKNLHGTRPSLGKIPGIPRHRGVRRPRHYTASLGSDEGKIQVRYQAYLLNSATSRHDSLKRVGRLLAWPTDGIHHTD